jgi:hypothetical protein
MYREHHEMDILRDAISWAGRCTMRTTLLFPATPLDEVATQFGEDVGLAPRG